MSRKGLVGLPSYVVAFSVGSPTGFGARALRRASDGSSFDQAETADPYCTCQY